MNIAVSLKDEDLVMIFTENEALTPEVVEAAMRWRNLDVIDVYEVRDDELQYYCYDPLWSTPSFEAGVLKNAEKWFEKQKAS